MAAQKKATAAKKDTKKGSAPVVLADGKTEAKPAALRAACQVYGVEAKEDATTEELLALVKAHVEKSLKGHRCTKKCDSEGSTCPKLRCAVCKEVGTEETSFCPFCGDEGEGSPGGEATPAAPPAPPAPATEEVAAPAAPAEESPEEPSAEAGGEDEAPPAPEGEESQGEEEAPGEELATTEEAMPMEQMKAKLQEAQGKVEQYLKDIDATGFDMGLVLRQIHEDELWKAEEGCRNFAEYVEGHFPMKKSTAYELMAITKKFDKETFLKVGRSKLYLIAKEEDPAKQDEQLRQALEGGATVESIKVERRGTPEPVSEEPKRGPSAPAPEREPSTRSTPEREPPAPAKSAPKGERTITLLAKVGSKPAQAQWRNGDTGRVLAHFRPGAYSEVPISEEVTLHLTPKVDEKGIKANVVKMLMEKQGMTEKQAQAVVDGVLEHIVGLSYRFMEAV